MDVVTIRERIENEYRRRGDQAGWRLLSSPWKTTTGADIAFIGLNPGGNAASVDHPELHTQGSAYRDESWGGAPPGQSPLQKQVLRLFACLEARPEDVLAGNLIPFRSPTAAHLKDMRGALEFGCGLWRDILASARPATVVAMSGAVTEAVRRIGRVSHVEKIEVGWGNLTAQVGEGDFRFIGLPHLSRFQIMSRPKSSHAVRALAYFHKHGGLSETVGMVREGNYF